jgi:hypothetical protein
MAEKVGRQKDFILDSYSDIKNRERYFKLWIPLRSGWNDMKIILSQNSELEEINLGGQETKYIPTQQLICEPN